jgi:hypothetical protein
MFELEKSEKYNTKLKTCDIDSCKGMCCYDGIYLMDGEEEYLKNIVQEFKEYFSFLPDNFIVDGNWKNVVTGRKTEIRKYNSVASDFPNHFERTLCVFAKDDGKCSLQSLAYELNIHKWTFKPVGCWMFPLRVKNGKLVPPTVKQKDDPDYFDDTYPGYSTYVRCGKNAQDGDVYERVLSEEIEYIKSLPSIPYFPFLNKSIKEIVENNDELLRV